MNDLIIVFSEKVADKHINDYFLHMIYTDIEDMELSEGTEEFKKRMKAELNFTDADFGVLFLYGSGNNPLPKSVMKKIYSYKTGAVIRTTIKNKSGFVAMTKETAHIIPLACFMYHLCVDTIANYNQFRSGKERKIIENESRTGSKNQLSERITVVQS